MIVQYVVIVYLCIGNSTTSTKKSNSKTLFYEKTKEYWKRVNTSDVVEYTFNPAAAAGDERQSRNFISMLRQKGWLRPQEPNKRNGRTYKTRALDCGAGIGRVTQNVLLTAFDEVDLVELTASAIAAARRNIEASANDVRRVGQLGRTYNVPLQDFVPEAGRTYDLIWLQWVTEYLTDADIVTLLMRLRSALALRSQLTDDSERINGATARTVGARGLLVIKCDVYKLSEKESTFYENPKDGLVRSKKHFHRIFEKARLKILLEKRISKCFLNTEDSEEFMGCETWVFVLL